MAFELGEAFQFDWSEDWVIIGNERTKLQVAHRKLSSSCASIVRAYLLQTHEMLFDAHNHAFHVLGGIPGRGIYDNMPTSLACPGCQRSVLAAPSDTLHLPELDRRFSGSCNPLRGKADARVDGHGGYSEVAIDGTLAAAPG